MHTMTRQRAKGLCLVMKPRSKQGIGDGRVVWNHRDQVIVKDHVVTRVSHCYGVKPVKWLLSNSPGMPKYAALEVDMKVGCPLFPLPRVGALGDQACFLQEAFPDFPALIISARLLLCFGPSCLDPSGTHHLEGKHLICVPWGPLPHAVDSPSDGGSAETGRGVLRESEDLEAASSPPRGAGSCPAGRAVEPGGGGGCTAEPTRVQDVGACKAQQCREGPGDGGRAATRPAGAVPGLRPQKEEPLR